MIPAQLGRAAKIVVETARLMIGLPSYERYLAHMAEYHPDHPAMDRGDFFRNRESARFGANGSRRCC